MQLDWPQAVKNARQRMRLSQAELAQLAGLSPESVRAYEAGRRKPRARSLKALLDALKLDRGTRNDILVAAGFAPDGDILRPTHPSLYYTTDEAAEEIERYDWPAFILSEMMEVVAANQAAQLLWGVDLRREFTNQLERNMLGVASNPRFADRCRNWDEAVGTIIAGFKGHTRGPESYESPSPYFAAVLEQFLQGDKTYVARFLRVWEHTEPLKLKMHWFYPVVWDEPGIGEMRFRCLVCAGNEADGLSFNHWVPADAITWERLERLKEAQPART